MISKNGLLHKIRILRGNLKYLLALTLCGITFGSTVSQAEDREITRNLSCNSSGPTRSECPVKNTIQYARMVQAHSIAPCEYGYSWGFMENGIWVGDGCRADFEVTVLIPENTVDPVKLERRVTRLQRRNRKLQEELAAAKSSPTVVKRLMACLDVASKRFGQRPGLRRIQSATPRKGDKWTILGTMTFGKGNNVQSGLFLCQTERQKVINLQYPL